MPPSARLTSMNVALRKPMTREEFFLWAEAQEGRYEFDGFQPVAMTGGTNNHGFIVVNIISELRNRLKGKTCRVMSAESGGIATTGETTRYPDATVTCSPVQGQDRLIPNPVVVFEVVSESNARTDRFTKMREYHEMLSIKRYVLVEQATPVIVSYTREGGEAWAATSLSIDDMLAMPEIGIEIPVSDIFDGISFGSEQNVIPLQPE